MNGTTHIGNLSNNQEVNDKLNESKAPFMNGEEQDGNNNIEHPLQTAK